MHSNNSYTVSRTCHYSLGKKDFNRGKRKNDSSQTPNSASRSTGCVAYSTTVREHNVQCPQTEAHTPCTSVGLNVCMCVCVCLSVCVCVCVCVRAPRLYLLSQLWARTQDLSFSPSLWGCASLLHNRSRDISLYRRAHTRSDHNNEAYTSTQLLGTCHHKAV